MLKAPFLPMSKEEMKSLGWDRLDFIIVTGDAYVDHPSFGAAIIGRVLENEGFRVGIISQPDWRDIKAFKTLGRPRLAWLVTAGNLDSMVNHYTASRKPRSKDAYSPGGRAGLRPDRATLVYSQRCRQAYKEPPVIIGGIEASLRRFAHYDYWDDSIRRSFLIDAKADVLVYGMAERSIRELARELSQRRCSIISDQDKILPIAHGIKGCCYVLNSLDLLKEGDFIELPSYKEVLNSKADFARAFLIEDREQNPYLGKILVQAHDDCWLV
ncbi:MAG: YgiQ family radical SAM protein, partial [Peptococcaceae bacterium]|nr:YgiQ family radical SAM protein [Peptococcaceae bacterium]